MPARLAIRAAGHAITRGDQVPAGRCVDAQGVGHQLSRLRAGELRVPEGGTGQVHALRIDDPGRLGETAGVLLGADLRLHVHQPGVFQPEARGAGWQGQPVARHAAPAGQRCAGAVDAGEAVIAGRGRELFQRHAAAGDGEIGSQHELHRLLRCCRRCGRQGDLGGGLQPVGRRVDGRRELVVGPVGRRLRLADHQQDQAGAELAQPAKGRLIRVSRASRGNHAVHGIYLILSSCARR